MNCLSLREKLELLGKIQMMQTLLCQIQERAGSNSLERLSNLILSQGKDLLIPPSVSEVRELQSRVLGELLQDLKNYVGELERLVNYSTQEQEKKQDQ
jgi:hypothetical protein